eukprot:Opistho-1_new@45960
MMTDPMLENATVESLFSGFENVADSFVPSGFEFTLGADLLGLPMDEAVVKTTPATVPAVPIKLEVPLTGGWMERSIALGVLDAETILAASSASSQTLSVPQSPLPSVDPSESVYGDASSTRRRPGKRPLDTDDDKLANKRMRNRLAAQKCRMKKAQESMSLEKRAGELKRENTDLRDRLSKMQAEVEYLRNLIKVAVRKD